MLFVDNEVLISRYPISFAAAPEAPVNTVVLVLSYVNLLPLTAKFEEMATSPEKAWTFVCAIYKYRTIFLAVWDAPKKMDVLGGWTKRLISKRDLSCGTLDDICHCTTRMG